LSVRFKGASQIATAVQYPHNQHDSRLDRIDDHGLPLERDRSQTGAEIISWRAPVREGVKRSTAFLEA